MVHLAIYPGFVRVRPYPRLRAVYFLKMKKKGIELTRSLWDDLKIYNRLSKLTGCKGDSNISRTWYHVQVSALAGGSNVPCESS
jgi:hypothetical protein